ncbi:MAG: hypothetical protein HKN98_17370 [Silicimonas sp.]|nr:hypothetical protein [Silicimonas sp.]
MIWRDFLAQLGTAAWRLRAHCVNSIFSLHALAARKLLQQRKFLCRCAARKPVIHANRSQNETTKDQVADEVVHTSQ